MNNIRNILLINFGGIGDEILFLPSVISLKKEFPASQITLALEPRSLGIQTLTDKIDKFLSVDIKGKKKYFELLKLLKAARFGNYDAVISSGTNKFIPILLFLTGIKTKIGYDSGKLSEKLLTYPVKLNKNQYAVNMYHDLVKPLTKDEPKMPELNILPAPKVPDSVLIHPGVSKLSVQKGIVKTISPEIWAEIIKSLVQNGLKVRLTGGADDKECIDKICTLCKDTEFENLYGQTKSLKDLAELISSADKFLCSDSAPLHIGVALKVRTFAIFGPTDDKKLAPPDVTVLKADDNCPLKPCLWEKRKTSCPNPVCLNHSAEKIAEIVVLK